MAVLFLIIFILLFFVFPYMIQQKANERAEREMQARADKLKSVFDTLSDTIEKKKWKDRNNAIKQAVKEEKKSGSLTKQQKANLDTISRVIDESEQAKKDAGYYDASFKTREVDGKIEVWEKDTKTGEFIFAGAYDKKNNTIEMSGKQSNAALVKLMEIWGEYQLQQGKKTNK